MPQGLDSQKLNHVFHSRPDLIEGIEQAADSPARIRLFNSIVGFVQDQLNDTKSIEPAHKKRRVDIESSHNGQSSNGIAASSVDTEDVLLEIKEISVALPTRRKFDLCFTAHHLYARAPGTRGSVSGMVYPWKNIEHVFYLPVPDKAQVQHNYVLLPRNSYFHTQSTSAQVEPLVFTVPATPPKPASVDGPNAAAASTVSDSYTTLFHWAINKCLHVGGRQIQIVAADPSKFCSAIRQAHRPNEPAVYIKAFRGSKEGYLFFLECGILWGFKKPLLFLPLEKISAISYTNVLQRTFNMVVEVFTDDDDEDATQEIEFSMLDQEDYNGINEKYVMRHKLQDRSLADQRRARIELVENVQTDYQNDAPDDSSGPGGTPMTDLQRAQQEEEQRLQDEEDANEEDYDPGSDADSDGSGTSSEEEDDDEAGEGKHEDDEDGDGDEMEEW